MIQKLSQLLFRQGCVVSIIDSNWCWRQFLASYLFNISHIFAINLFLILNLTHKVTNTVTTYSLNYMAPIKHKHQQFQQTFTWSQKPQILTTIWSWNHLPIMHLTTYFSQKKSWNKPQCTSKTNSLRRWIKPRSYLPDKCIKPRSFQWNESILRPCSLPCCQWKEIEN